jgi:hypothetical protein
MTNLANKLAKYSAIILSTSAIILSLLDLYGIDITGIVDSLGLPAEVLTSFGVGGLLTTAFVLYSKSATLSMTDTAQTISTETIKYLASDKEKRIEQIAQELITQKALTNVLDEVKLNNVLLSRTVIYNNLMANKNLSSTLLTDEDKAKLKTYLADTKSALSSLQFSLPDLIAKVGEENDSI